MRTLSTKITLPSKSHPDQDCYGNAPALGTDSIGVEVTAFSKGYGTELFIFPGTRKRRRVGAIQRGTEMKSQRDT